MTMTDPISDLLTRIRNAHMMNHDRLSLPASNLGLEICRILKEHEETRLIPIVIMTALDAVEDRVTGIKAGADDFLTKPVNEEELLARIETALKLKHTVDRKIGELRQLKDHFAKFVRLLSAPEEPTS